MKTKLRKIFGAILALSGTVSCVVSSCILVKEGYSKWDDIFGRQEYGTTVSIALLATAIGVILIRIGVDLFYYRNNKGE